MKLRYLFLSLMIAHNNASAMLGVIEAAAANPEIDALVETLGATAFNTFAHSSTLASLTNNSHSSQVVAGLQAVAPQVGSAVSATIASGGALPALPANNATQQALGLALNAAQQAETSLAANPSVKAKVCRILLGACMASVGAADLITNYVYTQKATEDGKKATSSVLGTPIDLTVMGVWLISSLFGHYQLGYGSKTK